MTALDTAAPDPDLTAAEKTFNDVILRVRADPAANVARPGGLR